MANRKGLRTISTSDDAEGPFLRIPKKKSDAFFARADMGKSLILLILGAFAGSILTVMTYRIGPFGGWQSMGVQSLVQVQPRAVQQRLLAQTTYRTGAQTLVLPGAGQQPAIAETTQEIVPQTLTMPGADINVLQLAAQLAQGGGASTAGQAIGRQATTAQAGVGQAVTGQTAAGKAKASGNSVGTQQLPPQTFYSSAAFPWVEELVEVVVCDNSCPAAKNAVCDDGRLGDRQKVLCDLGTDCADCGPWKYQVPKSLAAGAEAGPPIRPIQQLVARGLEVYTRQTTTQPSFIMPYTNWKHDVDVSEQLEHMGAVEQGLTQVWYTQLKDLCKSTPGKPPGLVVDVGGNFGWYSLFSAAAGCRVVSWEPVPHFRLFFMYGVMLNHFDGKRGIWGTASINGANIDRGIDNEGDYEVVSVKGERVDDVVKEDVALIKFDVEGFEPTAFASASRLFDNYRVENLCMEYSPGVYEREAKWDQLHEWPDMLAKMLSLGMRILHVPDAYVRQNLLSGGWDGNLRVEFEEVVLENLKYDQDNARRLANGRQLSCPMAPELRAAFPHWGCSFIPEGLHPKSFRGVFGHNTNIFATLYPDKYKIVGPVGTFGLDELLTEWHPKKKGGTIGMGGRPCQYIKPEVQIMHRCRCTSSTVCGADETLIIRLASEGKTFPMYLDLLEAANFTAAAAGEPARMPSKRKARQAVLSGHDEVLSGHDAVLRCQDEELRCHDEVLRCHDEVLRYFRRAPPGQKGKEAPVAQSCQTREEPLTRSFAHRRGIEKGRPRLPNKACGSDMSRPQLPNKAHGSKMSMPRLPNRA
eukprot:jgi/Botrbrau1/8217/Bobra.0392s0013.1